MEGVGHTVFFCTSINNARRLVCEFGVLDTVFFAEQRLVERAVQDIVQLNRLIRL